MQYQSFEELEIYKLAHRLCEETWEIMTLSPLSKDFRLKDQMNGSSGSIMDNIAEGFGRGGNKEFIAFLSYSRGSCCEYRSQLRRAFDRRHIDETKFASLNQSAQNINEQISRFINYLKSSKRLGPKFDNKK
ncbi:four helix bundle protein [Flavobacterium caeni]|uniref:Four helix bundle protein n=1 Tax=Flavobacterium caeni TaxID=490189 RepID=A0A1G5GXI2_9FLAO|nr:four helix bundle protein [Flavobacterium caeni]SCY56204.1 four helix bundle protein [Flavobacterium caeni]